jgi:hypothetical protein
MLCQCPAAGLAGLLAAQTHYRRASPREVRQLRMGAPRLHGHSRQNRMAAERQNRMAAERQNRMAAER